MARTQTATTTAAAPALAAGAPPWPRKKSQLRIAWGRFRRDRMALLGGTILCTLVFMAIFAPLLSPHHPFEMDVTQRLRPPGTPGYVLGTDEAGRDILSRLLWGGRISLVTAVVPVLAATLVSIVIGLLAHAGWWLELEQTPDVDAGLLLCLSAYYSGHCPGRRAGSWDAECHAGAVCRADPVYFAVAYGAVLTTKNLQFVEAARSCGARGRHIIFHEILPNIVPPVIVYATTLTGLMVILAAVLSFLGLGVHPPAPIGASCSMGGDGSLPSRRMWRPSQAGHSAGVCGLQPAGRRLTRRPGTAPARCHGVESCWRT